MTGRVEQVGGVTGTAQQENKLFRCSTAAEGMEGRERKSKERGVEDLGRQGREAEVRLESEEVEVGVEEEGSEMHMYISIRCCSAGRQAGQASQGWKGWDHSWPSVVDEHLGREGHGSPSPHAATAALLLLLPPHEHVSFCHGLDPASGSGGGATQGLSLRQVDG